MKLLKREIEGKKGIVLIMAMWIMTILAVVAVSFAFMMRTEMKMAGNYRNGVKAHYLALAGVEHAIAVLRNDTNQVDHLYESWFTTFATGINYTNVTWTPMSFSFGDGTYEVHLSDENGKYNLNYPNRSGLQELVSLDKDATPTVIWMGKICGIKDYADSDLTVQQWSSVDRGYELAGVTQKPFETVYEIQKVRGYLAGAGYGIVKINDGFWSGAEIYDNPLDPPSVGSRGQQSDMTVYSQDYNTQVDRTARSVDVVAVTHDGSPSSIAAYTGVGFTTTEAQLIVSGVTPAFTDYTYYWMGTPPRTRGVGAPGYGTLALYDGTGISGFSGVSVSNMISAADKMTAGNYDSGIIHGAVNINTANLYGLQTLFMVGLTNGQDVIDYRNTTTFTQRGEIMNVGGIKKAYFQWFGDQVTVRSDRFRIYSTGKVNVAGTTVAARKIEAVINRDFHDDGTMGPITILYWSEKVFED